MSRMSTVLLALFLAGVTVSVTETVYSPAEAQTTYEGRKVITAGGTYSGNWQSLDPNLPAVEIKTTAPVIIEKCNVRGKGDLIKTAKAGAQVTVRDCNGYGLNPGVAGRVKGRFVHAVRPGRVVVENNYLQDTTGIKIYSWTHGVANETIKVRYNKARNIDGRKSTGAGYSTDKKNGFVLAAQFFMLHSVHDVPGTEIAWNQVTEEPNKSRVEDTINLYASGGSAASPYRVHDNFIDGAFPIDPGGSGTYSGGGIITDGGSVDTNTVTQYVHIYNNQVIDSLNYGAKISQGHHNKLYNNTAVRDGRLSDGTVYASDSRVGSLSTGAGIALQNAKNQSFFGYHEVYGNKSGWYDPRVSSKQRKDNIMSTCSTCAVSNNTAPFANPLGDDEAAERTRWQNKLATNSVVVGPRTAGP